MKKLLTCSAAIALMLAAAPVQAQSYSSANNAKDHDNTMGSATYSQPEKQADAAQTTSVPEASVEPAAGYTSTDTRLNDFTGPYVGGEVGYHWANTDVDGPTAATSGSADMRGWGGGAFVGYGMTMGATNGFYLGGELGYDWVDADASTSGGISVEEKNDFRATVRPGVAIDKFLGYGIAGYTRASFDTDPGGSEGLNGYVLGLGAEGSMGLPLKARIEYTYSGFKSRDLDNGLHIDPHDNEVRVGLLYQFK